MRLENEELNRQELAEHPNKFEFLYPNLNDPNFNIKIAEKKEFSDTKYDGQIYDVKEYADILSKAEFELSPHQAFIRNFMSFQTPYNSLLLDHGLGSGKTCTAIGVTEEMRDYSKQMGISNKIIVVASPNVQDNFKLQLFDERKLKLVDGIWNIKGCIGNKLLKEINPTNMKGLTKEKLVQQVKSLINASYSFMGYTQFANEITRVAGENEKPSARIRNLQQAFNNRLIVIDEVHNIRISDDNENKNIAKNLMYLVTVCKNVRLLLLSATPMFNNYKEIIWLLNLMNLNDKRGVVSIKDIFDKDGNFKQSQDGKESGKELLIRKVTGYISYVRGENPYTFPFRVYPNLFAPKHTFQSITEYPKYQMNCKLIPDDKKINKIQLYLSKIGDYQELGYAYVIDILRKNKVFKERQQDNDKTKNKNKDENIQTFGYSELQIPLQSLNIVYPMEGLEELVETIEPCQMLDEADDNPSIDVSDDEESESETGSNLDENEDEQFDVDVDEILSEGPKVSDNEPSKSSELESEEFVDQGVEGVIEGLSSLDDLKTSLHAIKENEKEKKKEDECEELEEQIEVLVSKLKQKRCAISKSKTKSSTLLGGKKGDEGKQESQRLNINTSELTGTDGLQRVMKFIDTKTPSEKGAFEYKASTLQNYGAIFSPNEIGKYSSKIKSICESIYDSHTNTVSSGIVLIYSSYIDGGIVPMALALEEMGFTRYTAGQNVKPLFKTAPTEVVDVRTMKPPSSKKDFMPAKYVMITGDVRLSPNNVADVNALTNEDNINGHKIKVVLISQAGSEGLDFKAIRQIHIMEPWYNMNRIEQITGRGVRNFSHKDLPFEQRNVEIFLHGTILTNPEEEPADLYVYRVAELKAIKIGRVTRLLKQTAVDCIINHDQTEFTSDRFKEIEQNRHVKQILSTGVELTNFEIGDIPNSANCDYMDTCEYDCLPDAEIDEFRQNYDTYTETFMLINSDKIIQKIKALMRMRYFYKKRDLFHYLNTPKKYPTAQIYAALTQMLNDQSEYILDRYGRTGYLINVGEYYLFQPSELNYKNVSIFDRSVPLDFKHNMIQFDIKEELAKHEYNKPIDLEIVEEEPTTKINKHGKKIFEEMRANYDLARITGKVDRGEDNWYKYCGIVILKMRKEGISIDALQNFLIDHIIESLMYREKVDLLNYLHIDNESLCQISGKDDIFLSKVKKYFCDKIIRYRKLTSIVLFDGPSRKNNLKVYMLKNHRWVDAEPEDIREIGLAINDKFKLKPNLNQFVGFMGFEEKNKYMIFKVKDTTKQRHTGSRCDQAGKKKTIDLLNEIVGREQYTKENTKGIVQQELCIFQEFTLRNYERERKDGKTWFLNTEMAVINEF